MYKVTQGDTLLGYSDTAVFVKLHTNGCYIPCSQTEAQGVCVKTPYTYEVTDEETGEVSTITTVRDVVYALREGAMKGTEEVATLEQVNGALVIEESEQVVSILLGGE